MPEELVLLRKSFGGQVILVFAILDVLSVLCRWAKQYFAWRQITV